MGTNGKIILWDEIVPYNLILTEDSYRIDYLEVPECLTGPTIKTVINLTSRISHKKFTEDNELDRHRIEGIDLIYTTEFENNYGASVKSISINMGYKEVPILEDIKQFFVLNNLAFFLDNDKNFGFLFLCDLALKPETAIRQSFELIPEANLIQGLRNCGDGIFYHTCGMTVYTKNSCYILSNKNISSNNRSFILKEMVYAKKSNRREIINAYQYIPKIHYPLSLGSNFISSIRKCINMRLNINHIKHLNYLNRCGTMILTDNGELYFDGILVLENVDEYQIQVIANGLDAILYYDKDRKFHLVFVFIIRLRVTIKEIIRIEELDGTTFIPQIPRKIAKSARRGDLI